ncbi:c-type cytochrome [Salinibius halmophilus]|uniref:c-type cytochrome n=1 Tax=Salinibius halmophilus TaxID=1853216 RepID=UPI0013144701|nr:cytochrome c [Salinibius halmophilus]
MKRKLFSTQVLFALAGCQPVLVPIDTTTVTTAPQASSTVTLAPSSSVSATLAPSTTPVIVPSTTSNPWVLPSTVVTASPTTEPTLSGQLVYQQQCSACHGETGDGGRTGTSIIDVLKVPNLAIEKTTNTMPVANPNLCDTTCAQSVVAWLRSINDINSDNNSDNVEPLAQIAPERHATTGLLWHRT